MKDDPKAEESDEAQPHMPCWRFVWMVEYWRKAMKDIAYAFCIDISSTGEILFLVNKVSRM